MFNAEVLPVAGGWLDQPLDILVKLSAMKFVESTWRMYRSKDSKTQGRMTKFQWDVISWLEN